jgi:Tfp pilus assembly protein PilN
MRAVNLIPSDVAGASRSSAGPLLLIGGLAVLLALVTALVLTGNTIKQRRADLADVQSQLAVAQAQADATRPYRDFAALARARVETVRQLGEARFDWERAFRDLATVIPDDVWLSALTGTVTTGVSVAGGSSAASGLRGAIPNPAIELSGCTVGHEAVVRLISRLRLLRSVQRVSLADSSKDAGGDCQNGNTDFPAFNLVVFFEPIPTVQPPVTADTTSTAPVADTSGATSTTTPPTSSPAPSDASQPKGVGDR